MASSGSGRLSFTFHSRIRVDRGTNPQIESFFSQNGGDVEMWRFHDDFI